MTAFPFKFPVTVLTNNLKFICKENLKDICGNEKPFYGTYIYNPLEFTEKNYIEVSKDLDTTIPLICQIGDIIVRIDTLCYTELKNNSRDKTKWILLYYCILEQLLKVNRIYEIDVVSIQEGRSIILNAQQKVFKYLTSINITPLEIMRIFENEEIFKASKTPCDITEDYAELIKLKTKRISLTYSKYYLKYLERYPFENKLSRFSTIFSNRNSTFPKLFLVDDYFNNFLDMLYNASWTETECTELPQKITANEKNISETLEGKFRKYLKTNLDECYNKKISSNFDNKSVKKIYDEFKDYKKTLENNKNEKVTQIQTRVKNEKITEAFLQSKVDIRQDVTTNEIAMLHRNPHKQQRQHYKNLGTYVTKKQKHEKRKTERKERKKLR